MKKTIFSSLAICLLLSGCGSKKKNDKELITNKNINQKTRVAFSDKDIYDENVGAFELEEDVNPLSSTTMVLNDGHSDMLSGRESNATIKTAYFDFDQYSIKSDQKDVLDHNIKRIKDVAKGKTIVIEGHACKSAGSDVYNMMLSEKRAEHVKKYFAQHGISEKSMKTVGRGSEMLVVPAGSMEQQAPNRRVEIYLYDKAA